MMSMKQYKIPVEYKFRGYFLIRAESRKEAAQDALNHCGACGIQISSNLPDEDVDWEFPLHPEERIYRA
jgi:hypothetical protein